MLDWLRRPASDPTVEIGGRSVRLVIRRLRNARRMTMRLAANGSEVHLSIPAWVPSAEALAFVRSRHDWLAGQMACAPQPIVIAHGTIFPFRGQDLRVVHQAGAARLPAMAGQEVVVGGAEASLSARLRRWLQLEAKARMEADLADYCPVVGKSEPALALSNARRRWGSCSHDGKIRINWRLIMAPDLVRRSVVAHEVAHLVHFDHSAQFHGLLGQLFEDDMAQANRWLKDHGRMLYRWFG